MEERSGEEAVYKDINLMIFPACFENSFTTRGHLKFQSHLSYLFLLLFFLCLLVVAAAFLPAGVEATKYRKPVLAIDESHNSSSITSLVSSLDSCHMPFHSRTNISRTPSSLKPSHTRPSNMAIPEHNPMHNHHHYQHEALDQWLCSQCFKTISPTRPPILNLDNCSCVDLGSGGGGGMSSPYDQPRLTLEQPVYTYDTTTHQQYNTQQLGTSTTDSAPERTNNATYRLPNTYLTLGPETGLNEAQHRRSASFESEMSYQMRRFLVEQSYDYTAQDAFEGDVVERDEGNRRFLKQDVNIGYGYKKKGSRKVHKGSKVSWISDGSGREEEGSWTLGARCVAIGEMGAWVSGHGAGVEMERDGEGWYGRGGDLVLGGFTEYREGYEYRVGN